MNYKLAKKLKEAGFIQRQWKYSMHFIPDRNSLGEQMIILYENYQGSGDDLVYIPTLSELIEACGDSFYSLSKHLNIWQTNFRDGVAGETAGKTPEEAVANLWLNLKIR